MITEDYVSLETAKLLKEKGFDEPCVYVYCHDGSEDIWDADKEDIACQKPTLQRVMKWLREEKKLSIIIQICFDDDRNREMGYYFNIWQLTPFYESMDTPILVFDTYEEACEAAFKYCLENLI